MSLFDKFVGGSVELPKAPVPPRTVVFEIEHMVGSKSKRFMTKSAYLGVDRKRPLSYVEMQSIVLEFDLTPGGQRRHWLSRKEVSKGLQAEQPGRDWYWLCSSKSIPSLGRPVAEVVQECLLNWREALLPYILDSALPCPWEGENVGDDTDEESAVQQVPEPSQQDLMALWLQVQNASKVQVQQYAVPNGTPSMTRIG